MRTGGVPLAALLLVLASPVLQVSSTNDIYWEGEEYASNEFLEVKDEDPTVLGSLKRFKRDWNFFSFLSPEQKAETATDTIPDDTGSYGKDDDLDVGSGAPDKSDSEPREKTLRVTFLVMEPYITAYSNRDSPEFLNISRSLANAVDLLFESLPGTQRSSLVRIQSLVNDDFLCKVTLDIVTTRNEDTETIKEILRNHIKNNGRLGETPVRDGDFYAQLIDPASEVPPATDPSSVDYESNTNPEYPPPDNRYPDDRSPYESTPDYRNTYEPTPETPSNYDQNPDNSYNQNPYGQTASPDSRNPYDQSPSPDNRDPYGQTASPNNRNPYGESAGPDNRNPYGESTGPDNRNPYGQSAGPDNRNPYGESATPENRNPYGESTDPDNRNPYGQSAGPDNRNPYGESATPENRNPYGESTGPDNRNPYGQSPGPDNRDPYGQTTSPDNRNPYGESAGPDNRNPYGESAGPDNRNPYGESAGPDNRNPYGPTPRPDNRDPYGQTASPDNRSPYGQTTGPDNRNPYGQTAGPDNRDPYGQNAGPDSRNPYGPSPSPDNRSPNGQTAGPDNRNPYGETAGPDNRNPYGETAGPDNRDPYGQNAGPDSRNPYGQSGGSDNRYPYDQNTGTDSQTGRPDDRSRIDSTSETPSSGYDQSTGYWPRGDYEIGGRNYYTTDLPDETDTETYTAIDSALNGPFNECPPNHTRCDDTRCVETARRCDGFPDCTDGTDEAGCPSHSDCSKRWYYIRETQSNTQETEDNHKKDNKAKSSDKKRKHNAHRQERLNLLKKIADRNSTQSGLDENDLFFGSMAKIVKKLPPYEQVQLRLQIGSLVGNAELRQISNN